MDNNEEYHDPDYTGTSVRVKKEPPSLTEEEKAEKIRKIIQAEFRNEIDVRENEVMLADQRMAIARRMLHRLRYTLVARYYRDRRLQQPEGAADEPEQAAGAAAGAGAGAGAAGAALRGGQRRLHPSVRKLLGKQTADLEEIFRPLATRHKRRDYSAMVQTRNYTIPADGSASLRPAPPVAPAAPAPPPAAPAAPAAPRAPRRLDPKPENVLTLDEVTRNKMKHRYRIIIGNTSKYAPAASAVDRSTHKWLLYVRGQRPQQCARLLRAVTVTLHPSYTPHHVVRIDKPPYHISRRGWGEFPAKVELHFPLPDRNRPATVEHTIKLDRDYTGLQTLGAETLVDVWLYSTPEMLEFEYKEEDEHTQIEEAQGTIIPKEEPVEQEEPTNQPEPTDNWLDFFTTDNKELDVDEMIIKPVKKEPVKEILENHKDAEDVDVKPDILELENNVKMLDVKIEDAKMDWNLEKSIINPSETIPNEILSQPASPKKRIMKYLDPKTGKIYYLEMDRKLDLSKVQEIVINSKGNIKTAKLSPVKPVNGKKKGVSLLKPEVKNMLNNKEKKAKNYTHIVNDHCYLGSSWVKNISFSVPEVKSEVVVKKEDGLYECLCEAVARFTCVRVAVNYMLKKIPVVSEQARDPVFKRCFPFVESDERFWKMDFAKRRNKEWSRAKLINTILHEHFKAQDPIWRTKQILIFSRLHGYHPIRKESLHTAEYSWNDMEPSITESSTISAFKPEDYNTSITEFIDDSDDEEIEVVKDEVPVKKEVKKEEGSLVVIPVEREEDRHRFMFIERKCAEIGVELRNEDVGNGYSYSAVHAVMLSALKNFAEELVRDALAADLMASRTELPHTVWTGWAAPGAVSARALAAGVARGRLAALAARDCGAPRQRQDEPI